ncbi:MAG: 2-oxoacid:acceptor oxidoreductase subunit alpha [Deltaproteobacteria bacterium]|nr:2-oxoacid:acceptor oxidoreductase subunit alpha [Deltaproteobacteria bacterium]
MKADPKGVLTGAHFLDGDHACCEGALAAGCRMVFGYPITPSTEVVERIARRLPTVGGIFVQMEDEIASSIAIQGAAWGGKKVMTVTSGPGMSLMQEHIGFAAMTETPCVFVNVQRGGPSTGLPTLVAQGDMMQARWGSHGDYETIAIAPNSPQECFDLTIMAFNLAERYRVPVMFMMDESIGHMTERVVIPEAEAIEVEPRRTTKEKPSDDYKLYAPDEDGVPAMPPVGAGYRFHMTGLTHDEKGYPVMNAWAQEKLVRRLIHKILDHREDICVNEEHNLEDADIVIVAYGITSRVVIRTMEMARAKGLKVGVFRPVVVWPFPEKRMRELAEQASVIVVPELNYGQVVLEVERIVGGRAEVRFVGHGGGALHDPIDILKVIEEVGA